MWTLIWPPAVSFAAVLVLLPWVARRAAAAGLLDHPDGGRHHHRRAVPRAGGIAWFTAYLLGVMCIAAVAPVPESLIRLVTAAVLVFAAGLFDDRDGLVPGAKLAVTAIAALLFVAGAVPLTLGADGLRAGIAVIWIVAVTNAFNLIDGVDGLAAGLGVAAALVLSVSAAQAGNLPLAALVLPLAASLAAFLRVNAPPAAMFLGDGGSLTIGFLLAGASLEWVAAAPAAGAVLAPVLLVALPLLDLALTVARRCLRGASLFAGDRAHLHHRLLDRGWSPRQILFALFALNLLFGGLATLALAASPIWTVAGWAALIAVGAFMVQALGYAELSAVTRLFRLRGRSGLRAEIQLEDLRHCLRRAASREECWQALRNAAATFGFGVLEWHFGGDYRCEALAGPGEAGLGKAWIRLPGGGWLAYARATGGDSRLFRTAWPELLAAELPRSRWLPRTGEVA